MKIKEGHSKISVTDTRKKRRNKYCFLFRSWGTFSKLFNCTIKSHTSHKFILTNKQCELQLSWRWQAQNFRWTTVPDQRRQSHHVLAVCQELHPDFHHQGESQEAALSYLKDRQIDRQTYACQDILTPVRLQKSGTRRDFSEAPANCFCIIGMNFYVFKVSTQIKKSCFPL